MHQLIYDHIKSHHKGKDRAISMNRLAYIFAVSERQLRQMVKDMRENKVLCNGHQGNVKIIGDSHGYYMPADEDEHRLMRLRIVHRIKRDVALLRTMDNDFKEGQVAFDFDEQELKIIKETEKEMDQLYTISEIAELLKISKMQVYRLIEKGMPYMLVGQSKRFNPKEVETWLKKTTSQKV